MYRVNLKLNSLLDGAKSKTVVWGPSRLPKLT
jgi:hypothetical protein